VLLEVNQFTGAAVVSLRLLLLVAASDVVLLRLNVYGAQQSGRLTSAVKPSRK